MELDRPFQAASQLGLGGLAPGRSANSSLDQMLGVQHWPYIGCCAMVASYAGLIAAVAEEPSARHSSAPDGRDPHFMRLKRGEMASHIDLAESSIAGLAAAWPLVKSFQEEISQCKLALECLGSE